MTLLQKSLTVITNSAFIASYVRDSVQVHCVLLGGTYQRDSQVMVGPLLRTCVHKFYVERLFIGSDGWIDGVGFTNADQMRADAVHSMAEAAAEVVVLTESEKFGQRGAIPMCLPGRRLSVITDGGISDELRQNLESSGISVTLA